MEAIQSQIEQRGDRRGKVAAGTGFLLVIALLLLPIFFFQNPPPGQPGILVNLGFVDMGEGDENAPAAQPAAPAPAPTPEPPTPAPATPPPPPTTQPEPKPVERDVVVTEDPAEVALKRQKAQEEAKRQAEEKRRREAAEADQRRQDQAQEEARRKQQAEDAERRRQQAEAAEAKRKADAAEAARIAEAEALKGSLGGAFGGGRGETGKPGNQGVEDGDPNADKLQGISTGNGRVSGGLGGRGVLASPPVRENSQVSGTVVVSVCVNPDGRITRTDYTQSGSTTADPTLVAAAIANAKRWRFEANPLAPAEQCGKISYNFKVQ